MFFNDKFYKNKCIISLRNISCLQYIIPKSLTEKILSQARQSKGSTRGGGRRFPDRPLAPTIMSMQYSCYGIKCSKQQEILTTFYIKKYKKITNYLKVEKIRQKNTHGDPI